MAEDFARRRRGLNVEKYTGIREYESDSSSKSPSRRIPAAMPLSQSIRSRAEFWLPAFGWLSKAWGGSAHRGSRGGRVLGGAGAPGSQLDVNPVGEEGRPTLESAPGPGHGKKQACDRMRTRPSGEDADRARCASCRTDDFVRRQSVATHVVHQLHSKTSRTNASNRDIEENVG